MQEPLTDDEVQYLTMLRGVREWLRGVPDDQREAAIAILCAGVRPYSAPIAEALKNYLRDASAIH